MSSPEESATKGLLKKQTYAWAAGALAVAVVALLVKFLLGPRTSLSVGLMATAFAAYVMFWSRVHPRIYMGQGLTFFALLVSAGVSYTAFSELSHAYVWRRTFQLTEKLAVYEHPIEKWAVSYPHKWVHEEHGVSGSVIHLFKPSKVTPTMFFSVTSRSNVGTSDLRLVVDGFFRNLPQEDIQIHLKEPLTLASGYDAYRMIYSEPTRRIPLKSETLFVLDGQHLYFLTVSASPRWFDRHQAYLENLLQTLLIPS